MTTRREFIIRSGTLAAATWLLPGCAGKKQDGSAEVQSEPDAPTMRDFGIQLYTFRAEMDNDPRGTLAQIAAIGIKDIESARSPKGHYYGLTAAEMKDACASLGMTLRSGHVHLDDQWEQTMAEAVASGQEYLICSTMPTEGQTVDNYKRVAEAFNKAGEQCRQNNLKFGYHNHGYEFESENDQVLYDVLLDNCDAQLVHMELDLGWVVVGGKDPVDYFTRYPGRFPLWHLKDMNLAEQVSTEFGKGGLDIAKMMSLQEPSGVQYIFIEQEEYAGTPLESMKHNMDFLKQCCRG
jgi:sugar phosphate isomerase/epimerase